MRRRKAFVLFRLFVRILIFAAAIFLFAAGPLPEWIIRLFKSSEGFIPEIEIIPSWYARVIPSLSPFMTLNSFFAGRTWHAGLFWGIPPLLILLLAYFQGRFFCRWICPTGTIYAIPSKINFRKPLLKAGLGGYIFWITIFSSLAGLPLFLFLDPLSKASRLGLFLNDTYIIASTVPGLIIPSFLVLGMFQPMVWCTHICPLGYLFELLHRKKPAKRKFSLERRRILAGLFAGIPSAILIKGIPFVKKTNKPLPILAPGALEPEKFASLCSLCYACVNVCPTSILRPNFPNSLEVDKWFQPEMNPMHGVCEEFCNRCTQVCPTGAIRKLTEEQKRNRQIGIARVRRSACLAWADKEHCMVCDEYCPYKAIKTDFAEDGLPRPVVEPETCRGCGACQNACPATKDGVAIVIHGIRRQRDLNLPPDLS